jgi:PAS domain S-box-containing protein
MISIKKNINGHAVQKPKKVKGLVSDRVHKKAFENSFLPNIISIVSTGKIVAANLAAEKLLGYSGIELLSKKFHELFAPTGGHFESMLSQREAAGYATGDLSVIRKNGRKLPCQITSVLFAGDKDVSKSITTLVDRSEVMRRQTEIDQNKEKKAAEQIIFADSKSDATLHRLHSLERLLDKEITAKEISLTESLLQRELFEKELQSEGVLKAIQTAAAISEAKELERSDLGKELHDNVNQLLAASRIYMDLAKRNVKNRQDNIGRSSEYTLIAIEEIRKIAKGLVKNAIKNVGLCIAIGRMTHDLMQIYPIRIVCKMDEPLLLRMSEKFNLDIFRIVQEQVNNIIKHARASHVRIVLTGNATEIVLSIADNGVGFDVNKDVEGIGILNIKSRTDFYKGNAVFISMPGKGCLLTARFPVKYASVESETLSEEKSA